MVGRSRSFCAFAISASCAHCEGLAREGLPLAQLTIGRTYPNVKSVPTAFCWTGRPPVSPGNTSRYDTGLSFRHKRQLCFVRKARTIGDMNTMTAPTDFPPSPTDAPGKGWDSVIDGERVARIARARGLSQRQLADAVGVSEPHISRMLRRQTDSRLSTMRKFAYALGVPIVELTPAGSPIDQITERLTLDQREMEVSRQQAEVTHAREPSDMQMTVVEYWGAVPSASGEVGFRGIVVPLARVNVRGLVHPFVVEARQVIQFPGIEPIRRAEQILMDPNSEIAVGDFVLVDLSGTESFRVVSHVTPTEIELLDEDNQRKTHQRNAVRVIGKAITIFNQRPAPRFALRANEQPATG